MAISLTQSPQYPSLTQSPVVYTFLESSDAITSQSYQYVFELQYNMGDLAELNNGTLYTLEKYPNESGYGIFDVSRIVNATIQTPAEAAGPETIFWQGQIYGRWLENGTFVTSSAQFLGYQIGLDGYQLFNEQINPDLYSDPNDEYTLFPFMTDGPVTQSFREDDLGSMNIFNVLVGGGGKDGLELVLYQTENENYGYYLSPSDNSYNIVQDVPIGPADASFPFNIGDNEWFTILPATAAGVPIGPGIRFEKKCPTKYENIRIKWKNRYSGFDWFNFDLVSRQSFQTQTQQYKPQIGTWGGTSLSYNYYDASKQNYATDTIQTISVNSDYVSEDYNKIFKQLLVSDEIYYYDTTSQDYAFLRPLTIKSSNVQFKTQKVDKLIQYQFEFEYAQGYKLQF